MCTCRALVKCLRFMLDIPHGVKSPGRDGRGKRYPSMGMDCSKSDPNNSLYNGGKWARTMSGYIALNAVSFSVCLLHRARSVETLHINCREREERSVILFCSKGPFGTGVKVCLLNLVTFVLKFSKRVIKLK